MKVFISHKKEDAIPALLIKFAFENKGVSAYLDLLDEKVVGNGKTLTEHIKNQLNSCTDIIVVVSDATKQSWWVPFEIGMSAQVNMPTATYLIGRVDLPEYLWYWPKLTSTQDVSKYVDIRKRVSEQYRLMRESYEVSNRLDEVSAFYQELKRELR